jgi:catechol 2,3-dioxygenase
MQRTTAARAYGIAPPGHRLPDDTHLGRVRLQVSDLPRSLAYYTTLLGLEIRHESASSAQLGAAGAADYLLELRHERGTRPAPRAGALGLYHFAMLLPSRQDLGRFVKHLADTHVRFGAADHLVSEAIYLWDPDGLGIEVYADRPRDAWRTTGRELVMTTERLDLRAIADASDGDWRGMPLGATMGHMHLSVSDLVQASTFYHRALGLETTVWSYPGALFMAAGGYHHHLGTNTWAAGAPPASPHDARLIEWELVLPDAAAVGAAEESLRAAGHAVREDVVTDPWGVALRLRAL